MSRTRLLALLAIVALAAAIASCGARRGGGDSATVGPSGRITVHMDEYLFEPQDLTSAGGRLRVRVVNDGELAHNWKVFRADVEVGGTETFQQGGRRTATFDLRPGTYKLSCTVGNHDDLGMSGKLVIRR